MSYKGIKDLYNDLNLAVSNVAGLNQFYMLDESEVNKLRNINYPVCISSIPNSLISNINRAYEEYNMTLLILKQSSRSSSDYTELNLYDDCVDLFSNLSDEIMSQKDGVLIVQQDSFEIERVSKLGNDLATGIRVNFTLLAPSALAFHSAGLPSWNLTRDLFALFNANKNVVRTSNSLSWSSELPTSSPKTITHYDSNNVTAYSDAKFTFTAPGTNPTTGFKISNVTFSDNNWSVFFKISVSSEVMTNSQTLLRITDPSSGDGFIFGLRTNSGTTDEQRFQDGQPFYQINDDDDSGSEIDVDTSLSHYESSVDLKPLSETVIGIVNDDSNGKVKLYVGVGDNQASYDESVSHSNRFSDATILIGTSDALGIGFKGFAGTISHVAIYEDALTEAEVVTVTNDLNSLS
jgi:hypothetical protein